MSNVNAQRGEGVFDGSIRALQLLNSLGYGIDRALPLQLLHNPNGAFLPGPQSELEAEYKRELHEHFGIVFNQLYTITNLPIARSACGTSTRRTSSSAKSKPVSIASAVPPVRAQAAAAR